MTPGFIPWRTPDAPDAADRAKEFCRTRKLTPATAKIVRRDGEVMVVITKGCKLHVQK
jgi:ribosomal protein L36